MYSQNNLQYIEQKQGEDFAKFSGLLRIYELYESLGKFAYRRCNESTFHVKFIYSEKGTKN